MDVIYLLNICAWIRGTPHHLAKNRQILSSIDSVRKIKILKWILFFNFRLICIFTYFLIKFTVKIYSDNAVLLTLFLEFFYTSIKFSFGVCTNNSTIFPEIAILCFLTLPKQIWICWTISENNLRVKSIYRKKSMNMKCNVRFH